MGTSVGIGVVVAILVLLPLAAVWAARRWRDPPPERWAAKRSDLPDPSVVEVRLRKRYGLIGDAAWAPVHRAATRGEAAPDELRAATAEYAAARAESLEWQLRRNRLGSRIFTVLALVAVPASIVVSIVRREAFGVFYALYTTGLALLHNPWLMRRQADRARRAVELNGG